MAQEEIVIKNLQELLNPKFGHGKFLKDFKISRLTDPGVNYGSVMLKLELTVADQTKNEETINAVAKILPETEEFRKIFNVQTTYTKEMAYYDLIVPTLQTFQRSLGIEKVIDYFPKCYATRKNLLENSDKIDDNAIIVLENLVGFKNVDRTLGFDFDTTKLILKDAAAFHGVPLALKLKNADLFQKIVKPYCVSYTPPKFPWAVNILKLIIKEKKDIAHLSSKMCQWGEPIRSKINEPFATLVHSDLWVNNTMQKFVDGKAVENKLVDFQVFDYGSPAADIFFLLFTSVQLEVLKQHLDFLLKYYWEHLVNVLKCLKCDTGEFGYDKFLEELESVSEYEFSHALFFYTFICNAPQHYHQFEHTSAEEAFKMIPLRVKEKTCYIVGECYKRKWLK